MTNLDKQEKTARKIDMNLLKDLTQWACNGDPELGFEPIGSVSATAILAILDLAAYNFSESMTYNQVKELLIGTADNLITDKTPHYDRVATRLLCHYVREQAYGSLKPPHIKEIIENNIKKGYYSKDFFLLTKYKEEEIEQLNDMIDHTRDDLFRLEGAKQMREKYLMQNAKTKKVSESFQIPYILASAFIFADYPKETRISQIRDYYELASQHYIAVPELLMTSTRGVTNTKQIKT